MDKFIIEGGHTLRGEVTISGAKNAVLPISLADPGKSRGLRPFINLHELAPICLNYIAMPLWLRHFRGFLFLSLSKDSALASCPLLV